MVSTNEHITDDLRNYLLKMALKEYGKKLLYQDIEDLVQETLIRLDKYSKTFDKTKKIKYITYATKVLKNVYFDSKRGVVDKWNKENVSYLDLTKILLYDRICYNDVEKFMVLDKIDAIANNYFDDYHKELMGYVMEGYHYKDIAKIFNKNEVTIRSHISKNKKKIKNLL